MILKELKTHFENIPDNIVLSWGLVDVFSWRGSYDELAFSIGRRIFASKCKEVIERAYNETFYGYKGGQYQYTDSTPINFEHQSHDYSDGEYRENIIEDILGISNIPSDRDGYLVELMLTKPWT